MRTFFLAASVFFVAIVVSLMVALELHGNHAVDDGTFFAAFVSIGMALVFALGELILASLLVNVKGSPWLKAAGFVLLMGITSQSWVWIRAGFEVAVSGKDTRGTAQSEMAAWEKTLKDLERDSTASLEPSPAEVSLQAAIAATRTDIATAVQSATDLDNDGDKTNDRMIPGQLARVESLKADLANLDARADRIASTDTRWTEAAAALERHRATRKDVESRADNASVHQFDRWAMQWAPLMGLAVATVREIILAAVTTSLVLGHYCGLVCLNLSARIPLSVPEPAPEPVIPPKGRKPRPKESGVQLELIPAAADTRRKYECRKLWLNERSTLRAAKRKDGVPRADAERMSMAELRRAA